VRRKKTHKIEPLVRVEDDHLSTPEVGDWSEEKYRLVAYYAKMFATAMKRRWDCRVYIDLFAGAGHARVKGTPTIVRASPLLAIGIPDKFDKYIFCEREPEHLEALKQRARQLDPNLDFSFIPGDVNRNVDQVLSAIPKPRRGFRVLSFCFVDPFGLRNLRFETIRSLASTFIDFLILIPSFMDANRNLKIYLEESDTTAEDFLGIHDWRSQWRTAESSGTEFPRFFSEAFARQMEKLGYINLGIEGMPLVRSTERNLPLYHLAFFSRNKLGADFWKQVMKYSKDQLELDLFSSE
jgi:three-Cys-motif partner protein